MLVTRGHRVSFVPARPLYEFVFPVPLPEGADLCPVDRWIEVTRRADCVFSFTGRSGDAGEQLALLRRMLRSRCPPVVRYFDHALEGSQAPDFLRDEDRLGPLVDRWLVLGETARRHFEERLGPGAPVVVLDPRRRSRPTHEPDPERTLHPMFAVDQPAFGSIEDFDVSYGVHHERGNRDALSIVEGISEALEEAVGAAPLERPRELVFPPTQIPRSVEVEQFGCRFQGRADDLVLHAMRSLGWELDCLQHFFSLVVRHRCEWMLDVGSHVGLYGIVGARRYGLEAHLFEPQRRLYEDAVANARRNGVGDRVRVHDLAVSFEEAELPLVDDFGVLGRVRRDSSHEVRRVRAVALDHFLRDHMPTQGQRIAVKIDVEGHGCEVLQGMTGIVRDNHCVLQIEKSSRSVVEELASLGYRRTGVLGDDEWYEPLDDAGWQRRQDEFDADLRAQLETLGRLRLPHLMFRASRHRSEVQAFLASLRPLLGVLPALDPGSTRARALHLLERRARARGPRLLRVLPRLHRKARELLSLWEPGP